MSSFPCVGLKISRVPQAANMRSLGDADERHFLSAFSKKPGGQPGLRRTLKFEAGQLKWAWPNALVTPVLRGSTVASVTF
jgi:hypothetical protein